MCPSEDKGWKPLKRTIREKLNEWKKEQLGIKILIPRQRADFEKVAGDFWGSNWVSYWNKRKTRCDSTLKL